MADWKKKKYHHHHLVRKNTFDITKTLSEKQSSDYTVEYVGKEEELVENKVIIFVQNTTYNCILTHLVQVPKSFDAFCSISLQKGLL